MRRRELIPLLGAASIAWPCTARAQQPGKSHRLAILTQAEPVDRTTGKRERFWTAFFDELRRLGYDEGRNLFVAWHSSEGGANRVAELARDVVGRKPDAIFSPDVRMALVLKAATTTIPVVAIVTDPVGTGLVASLARPGGNITGFSIDAGLEIIGKRLDLFKQAVPAASRTALLVPRRIMDLPAVGVFRQAARVAGLTIIDAALEPPVDEAAYRRAFAAIARDGIDSLYVASAGESLAHRRLIAELAVGAKLPSVFSWREHVEAGGLMSYGNDVPDIYRRSAGYIDRILKGANPAEMPFQQPGRFELVINLKTAKALGLTLSPLLLAGADEAIE